MCQGELILLLRKVAPHDPDENDDDARMIGFTAEVAASLLREEIQTEIVDMGDMDDDDEEWGRRLTKRVRKKKQFEDYV